MTKTEFLNIPGVKARLQELAEKYGFSVNEFITVIRKESNFNTKARNPKSKATGLIQFMPKTAKGLDTDIKEISKMNVLEQLDLIDKYFDQNHTKGQHPYITVAYPKAAKMDMDDVIADSDSIIAKQNPGWRDVDGKVTKKSILSFVGAEGRRGDALDYFNKLQGEIEKKQIKLEANLVDPKDKPKAVAEIQALKLKYAAAKRIHDSGKDFDFNKLEVNVIEKDGKYTVETDKINRLVNETTKEQSVEEIIPKIKSAEDEITDIMTKIKKWESDETQIKKEDLAKTLVKWKTDLIEARTKHAELLERKNLLSVLDDEIRYFDQQINNIEWTDEEQQYVDEASKELIKKLPTELKEKLKSKQDKEIEQDLIGADNLRRDAVKLHQSIFIPWGSSDEVLNELKEKYNSPEALHKLKEMYARISGDPQLPEGEEGSRADINLLQRHLNEEGADLDFSWGSGFKMVKPGAIFKQWENSLVSSQEDEEAEELKKWELKKEQANDLKVESDIYTQLDVKDYDVDVKKSNFGLSDPPSDKKDSPLEQDDNLTTGQRLMQGGQSLLKGASRALDYIGGPGAIVSYIMGKKGLKEAMKEVKPQASAKLSPAFMQHLRQSRELSKKGFHPDEARAMRKEIDNAYQIGLENAVRGSGGQRARFLAESGVLDSKRSSALLDYATRDAALQRQNADKYEKLMMFKENFDIQQTEKERAEDMERQVANKKAAAQFTSAAFSNLMSGFGGSSLLKFGQTGGTNLFNQIQNMTNQSLSTEDIQKLMEQQGE